MLLNKSISARHRSSRRLASVELPLEIPGMGVTLCICISVTTSGATSKERRVSSDSHCDWNKQTILYKSLSVDDRRRWLVFQRQDEDLWSNYRNHAFSWAGRLFPSISFAHVSNERGRLLREATIRGVPASSLLKRPLLRSYLWGNGNCCYINTCSTQFNEGIRISVLVLSCSKICDKVEIFRVIFMNRPLSGSLIRYAKW